MLEEDILTVKELPLDDRPREKLWLRGAHSLTDAELLAIILRTGTKGKSVLQVARELLDKHGDIALLATKSAGILTKSIGVGKDKAATMVAVFELCRRISSKEKWFSKKNIKDPKDVADIFIPLLRDEIKEKFVVVCLNSANKIIKYEVVSIGSLNMSIVHPREVFRVAIENNSANIILIHNHPSGNPNPSREDIVITKSIVEAGKILDIQVFDHLIIAGNSFTSLIERKFI